MGQTGLGRRSGLRFVWYWAGRDHTTGTGPHWVTRRVPGRTGSHDGCRVGLGWATRRAPGRTGPHDETLPSDHPCHE